MIYHTGIASVINLSILFINRRLGLIYVVCNEGVARVMKDFYPISHESYNANDIV